MFANLIPFTQMRICKFGMITQSYCWEGFYEIHLILKANSQVWDSFLPPRPLFRYPLIAEICAGDKIWFLATESPLKLTKNAFYFALKALFILKIFKFLSLFLLCTSSWKLLKYIETKLQTTLLLPQIKPF